MTPEILFVLLVSLVFLIFGFFLIMFFIFHSKKMRTNKEEIQRLELEKAKKNLIDVINIQESERSRIGSDIHDDLGPTMSVLKLKINNLSPEKLTSQKEIDQLKSMVDDTIKNIRGLSHTLYPSTLEKYGIEEALLDLGNRFSSEKVKFHSNIDSVLTQLPFHTTINIYRVIQEFFNNSTKYSDCTELGLTVEQKEGKWHVNAFDNGKGFDLEEVKSQNGIGLKNMEMRADAINYSFDLSSEIGTGTHLTLISN